MLQVVKEMFELKEVKDLGASSFISIGA